MSAKEVMLYIYTTKDKIPKCMDGIAPFRIFFYDQNHQIAYKMNEECAKAMGVKIAEEGFITNYQPILDLTPQKTHYWYHNDKVTESHKL